ncbi:CubicO group peptidase, beta-lactamase class C family [Franzmannia pantelleriensis]|uniref:CubicO group peptidase, beta-lactamase class C family n=1 Tax=Franzmannia pantelleriensis TaxID=48727 RepID=A0A1G9M730_9GAMM|nr:serine hydrolase [Halomonas pantelleriensis]SDL69751.1 CubicO group peptidase, beta-lactamase class C family [Halomonas pantelleriensis]
MPVSAQGWTRTLVIALASLALSGLVAASAAADTPSAQALAAMQEAAERLDRVHAVVVAHDGEIVLDHHQGGPGTAEPTNVKSLSKTVLAALTGAAIHAGVIESDDQTLAELLGDRVPADADPRVDDITVGHLLALQAGLERTSGGNYGAWVASADWVADALRRPFVDEPGGRMLYSTGSSHLLSAALTRASGESTLALARRLLGEPLSISIPAWARDPQGIYFGGNDMLLSPLALIQIGELYRHDGQLNGQRILPADWVERSWRARGSSPWTNDGYGYGWFVTTLAGEAAYYGRGFGGQALYVIPERELTIAITSNPNPPSPGGQFQQRLNALVETLLAAE